ncbi:MerR family transcriptional regulator [Shouchella shacheensis]|uniref:MerR family transcriptional regulator n=1 Tax=Shouchella shacheensis TaxID=1649580 RepID=UPI0007403F3B|nr:MerR family transcriptional regulator [Shouchella shacheensis]
MTSKDGKYNIKAASTRLGIRPGTLRAWERRYQVICPARNAAGHRVYSDEQIAVLEWLIGKVSEGFTIKQAVELIEGETLWSEETGQAKQDKANYVKQLADELLEVLLSFNEQGATEILNEAFSIYSLEKVTIELLGTTLKEMLKKRRENTTTLAHERFVTTFLFTKIASLVFHTPVDPAMPRVVAACGPFENQELSLLIFTLYLRRKGFEVIFLGAGISEKDVELVFKEVNPKLFVSSCIEKENVGSALSHLQKIQGRHPLMEVGAIGEAFELLPEGEHASLFIGRSRADWEHWLELHCS